MWWMLAREVLRLRGTISREVPWEVMPDLYFYRDPEEVHRIFFKNWISHRYLESWTRKNSSRVLCAPLETVRVSSLSGHHQMSLAGCSQVWCPGVGMRRVPLPCDLSHDSFDVTYPPPPRPMDRQTWAVNIIVILLVPYSLLLNMISTSCCFRLRRKNNRRWKLSRRKQSLCSSRSDNRTGIQLT